MTTTTAPPTLPQGSTSLAHVVRSEWVKLWSVRSTMWTLLLVVILTIGIGALFTWGTESTWEQAPESARATFDAANVSLGGLFLAQLAIAVLGVMIISSEYTTGGIRTTFTAVPQRLRVLAAKGLVLAFVALVVGLITSFLAFFVGQSILSLADLDTTLGSPGVVRAVIGGGLYVAGCGMFGFALGALLRHTAGAVTLAVALLLVVPPFLNLLPGDWGKTVMKLFTSNAGQQITVANTDSISSSLLQPWPGYLVFTLWWVVILAAAAYLLNRRDA